MRDVDQDATNFLYLWASKCVFIVNKSYNKLFIYSCAFGHCVFVGIKLQQGFYEVFVWVFVFASMF
jgi:hypothetical protein